MFQSLVGSVETKKFRQVGKRLNLFQSLVGSVETTYDKIKAVTGEDVSISGR